MTMFTGVAFFFPDFAWLTEILGTPQIARAIHPFTGILMFFAFIYLALLYWDHNIPEKTIFAGQKVLLKFLKGMNTRLLIMANITLVKNALLDIKLGNGNVISHWHHYVASIFFTLLLNPSIANCYFTPLCKCFYVIHWYLSAYIYGILG